MTADRDVDKLIQETQDDQNRLFSAYREMLTYYFMSSVLVIGFASIFMIGVHIFNTYLGDDQPILIPLLPCVGLLGAVGSFFSALTRLYNINELPAALINTQFRGLQRGHLFMYCLIRPITGIIGAIIFYLLLMGGILSGDFFPSFDCSLGDPERCGNGLSVMFYYSPVSASDYAKSLIWSFIAGFSERFIPDTLDNMRGKS